MCGAGAVSAQGQWLGGGTAPDALPRRSPAEAGGSRREGEKEKKNHSSLPAHLKLFRAVLCWDLGTEPLRLNQWKAHDWFSKKMKLRDCLLFLEVGVSPGSFIHGLRIRAKHESQFKQHCSWRSWLSGLRLCRSRSEFSPELKSKLVLSCGLTKCFTISMETRPSVRQLL